MEFVCKIFALILQMQKCSLGRGRLRVPPVWWRAELRAEPPLRVSVQSLSRVRLFATPWTAAGQASLSITNSRSLLRLMSIELVMPSNHLILCCPLLLPPSIFLISGKESSVITTSLITYELVADSFDEFHHCYL